MNNKLYFQQKIEKDKVNDLNDLKGIGKEAWNFISAFYNMGWDPLIADSNGSSFRNKVAAKFMPKNQYFKILQKVNNSKSADKPVSINRLPPLISAKSPKEVNKIFKYFKKQSIKRKDKVQATTSSSINNIRKVLKIKETFSNL